MRFSVLSFWLVLLGMTGLLMLPVACQQDAPVSDRDATNETGGQGTVDADPPRPPPPKDPDEAAAPVLDRINPTRATVGSVGPSITVTGDDFVPRSIVQLDGAPLATTFVSATELRATIPTSKLAAVGELRVSVGTSAPGGGASREVSFEVQNPLPQLTTLSPLSVEVGASATPLTITGAELVPGATIVFGGASLPTTFVSSTSLSATIPASALATSGSVPVTLVNPSPGGGTSTAIAFTVSNPDATVTSVSPAAAYVGSAGSVLDVAGSGFVPGSKVLFNGAELSTTYQSGSALKASLPSSALSAAGDFPVTVKNPPPGGGLGAPVVFRVQYPVPTATSLSPATVASGSPPTQVTVTGIGFFLTSQITFDNAPAATTYVDATRLRATLTAAQLASAGNVSVRVVNAAPGGGTSSALAFAITNAAPTIVALTPSSVVSGSPDRTVTITGTGFVPSSTVKSNGVNVVTTYVSATQVTAVVPANQLMYPGSVSLTVTSPPPGGGTSAPKILTVGCDTTNVDVPLGAVGTTTTLSTSFGNAPTMARFQDSGACTDVVLSPDSVQPARYWIVQNTAGVPVTLSAWADCSAGGKQDDAYLTFYRRPTLPANDAERLGCAFAVAEGINGIGGYSSPDRGVSEWCPGLTKANGGGLTLAVCEKAVVHIQPWNVQSTSYPAPTSVKLRPE